MKKILSRLLIPLGAIGLIVAVATPAEAYRNYVMDNSFAESSGRVWYDSNRTVGFTLFLTDDAADGKCVYYQVRGRDGLTGDPQAWHRMTSDVCGNGTTTFFSSSSWSYSNWWQFSSNGYQIRACQNINNAQDNCASASAWTTRDANTLG